MKARRSTSMTAVGMINVVAGAIACALALLIISFSGAALLGGAGLLLVVVGFLPLCFGVLFTISGIGVLKMEPWGRTISILSGSVLAALCVEGLLESALNPFAIAYFGYGSTLVVLCYTPRWRMLFCVRAARVA